MNKNQTKEIIEWLKQEQYRLQEEFKSKITKCKKYDSRGVWITVSCQCGHEYRTPWYIPVNAKCPECKKYIFRVIK